LGFEKNAHGHTLGQKPEGKSLITAAAVRECLHKQVQTPATCFGMSWYFGHSPMLFRRLYSTAAHPARFQLPLTIRQLVSSNNEEISSASVTGWIKSIRKQKNITFAVISDGTTAEGLQAVILKQQGIAPGVLKR
jgi:hypothetical protein